MICLFISVHVWWYVCLYQYMYDNMSVYISIHARISVSVLVSLRIHIRYWPQTKNRSQNQSASIIVSVPAAASVPGSLPVYFCTSSEREGGRERRGRPYQDRIEKSCLSLKYTDVLASDSNKRVVCFVLFLNWHGVRIGLSCITIQHIWQ